MLARAPLERRRVLYADEDLGPRPGVGATVHVASARPDLVLQVAAAILRHLEAALARVGIAQEPSQLGAVPAPAPQVGVPPMIRRGPRRGRGERLEPLDTGLDPPGQGRLRADQVRLQPGAKTGQRWQLHPPQRVLRPACRSCGRRGAPAQGAGQPREAPGSAGAEPSRGRRGRLASPTSASRRQAARARRRGPRRAGHRSLAGLPRCACRPRRHGESDRGGPKAARSAPGSRHLSPGTVRRGRRGGRPSRSDRRSSPRPCPA